MECTFSSNFLPDLEMIRSYLFRSLTNRRRDARLMHKLDIKYACCDVDSMNEDFISRLRSYELSGESTKR